jgi:hypothetical protein
MFDFLFRNKEKETLPLPYSTEIHAHVIPGVDDGSQKNGDLIGADKQSL